MTPTELLQPATQPEAADRKQVATLQARAALAGFELVQLADGTFLASRWGMFRSFDHMAAASAWLDRVAPAR